MSRQWKRRLQHFGVRFGISLLVLGGLYLLVFGFKPSSHNKPQKTDSQKVAAVRSALAQTFISSTELNGFRGADAIAYDLLMQSQSQAANTTTQLQAALNEASNKLDDVQKQKINSVIGRERGAEANFKAAIQPLAKALQYEPTDNLNKDLKDPELLTRAQAAYKGIGEAADSQAAHTSNNGGGLGVNTAGDVLISDESHNQLQAMADCFKNLSEQLQAKSYDAANATRQRCVKGYPALRQQLIKNVLDASYNQDYLAALKSNSKELLEQLDALSR